LSPDNIIIIHEEETIINQNNKEVSSDIVYVKLIGLNTSKDIVEFINEGDGHDYMYLDGYIGNILYTAPEIIEKKS